MEEHTAWKGYLNSYLEEVHDGNYGVSLDIQPENQFAEVFITYDESSEEPDLSGIVEQLMREAQIKNLTKTEETSEGRYHLKLEQSGKMLSNVHKPVEADRNKNSHL